jgi:hypothetical protein
MSFMRCCIYCTFELDEISYIILKESVIVTIHKDNDKTDFIITVGYNYHKFHTKSYRMSFPSRLSP